MESHLHEWMNLLLRWIHFIVGVAWIGASFYFNWLENNLHRAARQTAGIEDDIAGDLWAIHGGGFYHLKKFTTGPTRLPKTLHWFKWEAYATWLSGFALLAVVYYFNARAFLIEPSLTEAGGAGITSAQAIAVGVAAVIGSWFVYDGLCRSPLKRAPVLLAVGVFVGLSALAWGLSGVFSGRAAYIHVGAAIGTLMAGNVFFVIIPAQKEMVAALSAKRALDPGHGARGLLRSRHNNYLTLPVLFIMISAHFPSVYGHDLSWALLALIAVAGWMTRHYFNVRQRPRVATGRWRLLRSPALWLPLAFALMAGLAWLTAPPSSPNLLNQTNSAAAETLVGAAQITPIIQARCVGCHAASPTQPGFAAAPAGLALESLAAIERNAARIAVAVATRSMPLGNLTGMTADERKLVAAWHHGLGAASSKAAP